MAKFRLLWLGNPSIEVDEKPAKLEVRKALAMIAYLSVSEHDYNREILSSLLWPEYDQQHASSNLRQCIFQVNKKLGYEFLNINQNNVGINKEIDIWIDIQELQNSIALIESHNHNNEILCDQCQNTLEYVIDLHRGDFLQGFYLTDCAEFEIWQQIQRDDLNYKISYAFETLVNGYAKAQNYNQGIRYALRWLKVDNCNEEAHRALMLLYSKIGMKRAAIRQYQKCTNLLKEELGVTPEAKTTELYNRILLARSNETKKGEMISSPHERMNRNTIHFYATKFSIPKTHSDLVPRARLKMKLEAGLDVPLTIISAPAGFGKTTLLADWAHVMDKDPATTVSWFCIDNLDNDPVRFLANFNFSLNLTKNEINGNVQYNLPSIPNPSSSSLVDIIIRDLQNKNASKVIIMEDFHIITNPEIFRSLEVLMQYIPPTTHLFISTRFDPPLAFSRMRSQKQLVEIRADDLRFTGEEIETYFNGVKKLSLTRAELYTLEKKTEGWIVALYFAARSLDKKVNKSSLIRSFSGSHKQIMDYIVEEVFSRQSDEVREFMLRTSILDRMNDSLCRAVTGYKECQSILEKIERTNLFLVALDDNRKWYRYHHLFAEVLASRLRQHLSEDQIRDFHISAARWYSSHHLPDEAIQHGLLANEYGLAVDLIMRVFTEKLANGEHRTLELWIERLPAKIVTDSHRLCIVKAWTLIFSGLIDEAEQTLTQAQDKLASESAKGEMSCIKGHTTALRAYITESRENIMEGIKLALEARNLLSADDFIIRAIMDFILGRSYRKIGNLLSAEQAFNRITKRGRSVRNLWMQAIGVCDTATIWQLQGRLSEASELCRKFLLQLQNENRQQEGTTARVYFRFANILYERNKLKKAMRHVSIGLNSLRGWDNPNDLVFGYIELFKLQLAYNDLKGASNSLAKATAVKGKRDLHSHLNSWITLCSIRYERKLGNLDDALRLARDHLAEKSESPLLREFELIEYIRVLVSCAYTNRDGFYLDEALNIIDSLTGNAKSENRQHRHCQLIIQKALCSYFMNKTDEALTFLTQALTSAESEGYIRTFVDEGTPLHDLLAFGIETKAWTDTKIIHYAQALLAVCD